MKKQRELSIREFLSLTCLARCITKHPGYQGKAWTVARGLFPELSDRELEALAFQTEKQRNLAICSLATKVPPLQKIETVSEDGVVGLACGHSDKVKIKEFQRSARCRQCLGNMRQDIAENLTHEIDP